MRPSATNCSTAARARLTLAAASARQAQADLARRGISHCHDVFDGQALAIEHDVAAWLLRHRFCSASGEPNAPRPARARSSAAWRAGARTRRGLPERPSERRPRRRRPALRRRRDTPGSPSRRSGSGRGRRSSRTIGSKTPSTGPTVTSMPHSSRTSRRTASSAVSPTSISPPGSDQVPCAGGWPRRSSSTRPPSHTTAPTPTSGRAG